MKIITKTELIEFDKPFAEPNVKYYNHKYFIERKVLISGCIIWLGISVNWKKELNDKWKVLTINYNAKPLDKYLPDIVYGEDRTYWEECEMPIYEKLYLRKYKINYLNL